MNHRSTIESNMVPGENCPSLVQTIRRQVLKRGRGRPRKLKSEKTVLEEEVVRKTDEEMADMKGIDEKNLLTIKDILMERENSGYSSDQSYFKENKDGGYDFVFGPIEKDLLIIRKSTDALRSTSGNSFGIMLGSTIKKEVDSSSCQEEPLKNNDFMEKRRKIDSMTDSSKYYTDVSKEEYFMHKNNTGAMTLVDKVFQKNVPDISLGVKYYTLREMEMNEYDKVSKTEEAIYGSRPNLYTKFIEENKDMFMNDCSLRCVFDGIGQIRKFPVYGDNNKF
uniref:HUN domain-containing protein n=1 Tax=Strongyloides venezuelensis TaxID=75913 RepID=A0A0K0FUU2_STRVS